MVDRNRARAALWWRWSWRDLRQHWVAVLAIAVVLGIGTGVYAGLGSTATWRRQSNDASFAALNMHDVRVSASRGTFVDAGTFVELVAAVDGGGAVTTVSERLVVDTQVDTADPSAVDPAGRVGVVSVGRLVGTAVADGEAVDAVWVRDGRAPAADEAAAVLEAKFADFHGLGDAGRLRLAGGADLDWVGLGVAPEDFYYAGPEGTILSQGELAIVYAPLVLVQHLTGRPGQVNDVVLTLSTGVDRASFVTQLEREIDTSGLAASVATRDDAEAYRLLYDDIDNDQRIWNAISALVLLAAALAAFNLVHRVVEAQRREIGIGMALGVARRRLAIRPMLIAVQVGLLGMLAGIGVGSLLGAAMGDLIASLVPMPVQRTPFLVPVFVRGAVLALVVPIVAAALPVWRAVSVEPIRAIRSGHLAASSSRWTDWTNRIRLPGRTTSAMPVRNLLRTPRRTLLTAIGVAAAITALIAVLGLLDSFRATIRTAGDELTKGDVDRIAVQLDGLYSGDGPQVAAIAGLDEVADVETSIRVPARLSNPGRGAGGEELDVLLQFLDLAPVEPSPGAAPAWTPTIVEGTALAATRAEGVVISAKAASDLGVGVGDPIAVFHLARRGGEFTVETTELVVSGVHANPMRVFAYADSAAARAAGLGGLVNVVDVHPADGGTRAEVRRALFSLPGVASSQPVAVVQESFDDALDDFVGVLVIAAGAVLALAVLIAFNTARITVEERRREHATMRAFGMPVRTVLGTVVRESVVVGVLATALGVAAGLAFVDWMIASLAATTLPDLAIEQTLSWGTVGIALAIGIAGVALAPLLLVRRIRRLDVPSALRLVE